MLTAEISSASALFCKISQTCRTGTVELAFICSKTTSIYVCSAANKKPCVMRSGVKALISVSLPCFFVCLPVSCFVFFFFFSV